MVMGGDSCLRGNEFVYQIFIFQGYICFKIVLVFQKAENKQKEAGEGILLIYSRSVSIIKTINLFQGGTIYLIKKAF